MQQTLSVRRFSSPPVSNVHDVVQLWFQWVWIFLRGKQFILFFVGNRIDWPNLSYLFRGERFSMFLCGGQHLFLILDLSDWDWETYNICFVQQNDSCQIVLCLQVKEILVAFYVHQHSFVKFWSSSQEEDPCIVFCVHQHYCIRFEFFSLVRVIVDSFMFSGICD